MTNKLQKRDESSEDPSNRLPSAQKKSPRLGVIRHAIRTGFRPRPLPKPSADRTLPTLPVIPRIAEVSRYSLARLEYFVSPGGGLRAWLKLHLLISLVIAIPALLVMPAVTLALGTFATWAEYLAVSAIHLLWAAVAGTATAGLVSVALLVIRKVMAGR